jgi:hypothetical protein
MAIDLGDDPYGTAPSPAEKLQIRTAIGVGTTDAPTFLAQSLTGQSLTGVQATSLVDLAATWNTSGTPTAIKLNVVETGINSNAASKLMDLQVGGVSRFRVEKVGGIKIGDGTTAAGSEQKYITFNTGWGEVNFQNWGGDLSISGVALATLSVNSPAFFTTHIGLGGNKDAANVKLWKDADGILAQRNGTAKQTLRIYNTYTSATVYERAVMDWNGPTPGNLQIGTEFLGGGSGMAARPIDFVTGGVVRMSLPATGGVTVIGEIITSTLANGAWLIRSPDTDTGIRFNGSRMLTISDTISVTSASVGAKINIRSDARLQWNETTNLASAAPDSGISRNAPGVLEINSGTAGVFRDLRARSVIQSPGIGTTVTPASNGDLVFETTSNTSVTVKLKGSDGTVRSFALTLV